MTVVQAIASVILAFLACNFFIQKFRDRHREEKEKSAEFLLKSQDLAAESEPANSEVKSQRKVKRKYRDGIATISEIFGKGGDGMYPPQGIEDAYGDLMVDNLLDISSSSFLKVTLDINENLVNTIRFVMNGKKDILSASEYVKRKIISGPRKPGKMDAGETFTGQLQRKLQATSIPRFRTLQAASNRATKPAAKATLRVVTKSLPSAAPPTTPITAKRTTAQTVTESAQVTSAQGAAKPGSGAAPPITVTITVNRASLISGAAPSTANETARTNSVPSASKPTTSTQVRTPSQTRTPKPKAAAENAPAVGVSVFANSVNGLGRDRSRLKSPRSSPIQSDPRARPDRIEPYLRPEPSTKSPVTEPPTLEPPGSSPVQSDPRAVPDRTERYLRPEPSHKSPVTEPSRLEQSGLLASLVLDPAAERSTSPEQRNYPHLRDLILRSVQLRPKDQSVCSPNCSTFVLTIRPRLKHGSSKQNSIMMMRDNIRTAEY